MPIIQTNDHDLVALCRLMGDPNTTTRDRKSSTHISMSSPGRVTKLVFGLFIRVGVRSGY